MKIHLCAYRPIFLSTVESQKVEVDIVKFFKQWHNCFKTRIREIAAKAGLIGGR